MFRILLNVVQTSVDQYASQPRFKGFVSIKLADIGKNFHEPIVEHLHCIGFTASVADTNAHSVAVKVAIQLLLALPVIVSTAVNDEFQKLLDLSQCEPFFNLPYFG